MWRRRDTTKKTRRREKRRPLPSMGKRQVTKNEGQKYRGGFSGARSHISKKSTQGVNNTEGKKMRKKKNSRRPHGALERWRKVCQKLHGSRKIRGMTVCLSQGRPPPKPKAGKRGKKKDRSKRPVSPQTGGLPKPRRKKNPTGLKNRGTDGKKKPRLPPGKRRSPG